MKNSSISDWFLAHRKISASFLFVLFLLIVMLRIFVFPTRLATGEVDWQALIRLTLDGLVATIAVGFIVAVTVWWTKPPFDGIPPAFEIVPDQISRNLERHARDSNEWEYVGHTGRYVRNRIFPILLEQSRRTNRPIKVRLMILDPRSPALCGLYADYRNRSRSGELADEQWTTEKVQAELLATYVKARNLDAEPNYINCEIRFRKFLSIFRFDISGDQIMVTQEDLQAPAYQYPRGSRFFEYYRRENQLVWEQSMPLGNIVGSSLRVDLQNAVSVRHFVSNFINQECNVEEISNALLSILNKDRSPYA